MARNLQKARAKAAAPATRAKRGKRALLLGLEVTPAAPTQESVVETGCKRRKLDDEMVSALPIIA